MTFGIIGALDEEIRLVKEKIELKQTVDTYGCTFYEGAYAGHRVVAVCSSVGTINAAVCASTLIREFGVDAVINVGIAGSLCKELHVLDVVVSDEVLFHDADLDILQKYYPHRRTFVADPSLKTLCIQVIEAMTERKFSYKTGRIASGDAYITDSGRKADIIARADPLCVEMEGAAIGQVAFMNAKPFLIIRTLSDNADENADKSYDNFMELAAANSAEIVLRMIAAYL